MQVLDVLVQKKEPLPYTNYWLAVAAPRVHWFCNKSTNSSTISSKGIHSFRRETCSISYSLHLYIL